MISFYTWRSSVAPNNCGYECVGDCHGRTAFTFFSRLFSKNWRSTDSLIFRGMCIYKHRPRNKRSKLPSIRWTPDDTSKLSNQHHRFQSTFYTSKTDFSSMNSPPAKRDGKSSYEKPPRKKKRMALRGTKGKHSVASSSGIHKEHQSSKKNTVSPPQKDECFAFMIDPPNGVDSKEIRITRLLENISLKDLWLGQMNAMLITTDGQKYKWYAGTWKPRHPRPVTQWEFHESDYYKSTESRAYLDEEGNVYTQVKNQGQAVPEWTKVEFPPGTSTIIDLVVSGQTFVALSKTGQLLTWGYDHHGSLGSSARAFGSSQERWMPHKVECLESGIRQISGRNSMVAAIKGNQLCTWGSNKEGMLGYFENREGEHYPFECLVQQDSKEAIFADCKEVRCGTNHVVALKNDGVVYAWGMGNKCQLGTWGRTFSATPVRIEINEKIRTINCGSTGSMALAESGNVYVW